MELMFQPLRKYANFQGRARRSEYWLFYLLFVIVYVVLLVGSGALNPNKSGPSALGLIVSLIGGLAILGMFVPMLAVTVRRLHDTNRSGWWLLLSLIPFIGGLVVFVFTVLPGTSGSNTFGTDPKMPDTVATVFS
jgi:uncharacterized membrane protein YhaH (DUF805 family)